MFDTVHDAVAETGADASMIYVPQPFAADATRSSSADAGIKVVVCITEGIPVLDMLRCERRWPAATCAWSARTARA